MIENLLCNYNASLLEALEVINKNSKGTCFIIDKSKKLKGILTDGDIRRALLNKSRLDRKVKEILSKDYVFGNTKNTYKDLMLKSNPKIKIIPIVDEKFKIVDVFEYNQKINLPVSVPNLNGNEFKYLTDAFLSTWISSQGEYIEKFEKKFSKYCDCKYGIACSNGTSAIHLALIALDIGPGDEVIVPDLTFAATINTVLHANAIPVIVDIEEQSWCIDPKKIEKAITKNTKVIIAIHIYGQPCDMDSIMKIAKKHNLKVIEDCAEAHGAMYDNKKVGSIGDIGCFSFYGNKVITTGEGGMCTTNNSAVNNKIRIYRDHGMNKTKRYWHDVVGYNYRMTNLQAAIGLAQVERIEKIHANRKKYEDLYKQTLSKENFIFQKKLKKRTKITWLASVLIDERFARDKFIEKLKNKGIDARPFFYPLSDMKIYKKYCKNETKITHKISRLGVSLPTYESLKSTYEIKEILEKLEL